MPGVGGIYERLAEEGAGLTRQAGGAHEPEIARFTLDIGNYRHICRSFGEDVALEVLDRLVDRVNRVLGADGAASATAYGRLVVRVTNLRQMQAATCPRTYGTWLWALCAAISTLPVRIGSAVVFPLLSADWERLPDGEAGQGIAPANPWHVDDIAPGCEAGESVAWAQRYRADMALAAEILATITPGEGSEGDAASRFLLLLWQPVHDAQSPGDILYYEALLRFVDRHGAWIAPSQSLMALERLGMVTLLDQHVVSRVLERLEADPDVRLAVNISARSARTGPWWREIMARLRAAPQVARRLTIEITETAALPDIPAAVRFVEGMRRLGCKVALDDFGVGFTSIRQIMALAPDVVKIDGFFIRETDLSPRGQDIFLHLVQLARSFGATVIVEGVETQAQAELALRAGVPWQQGFFWARPSVSLTRRTPDVSMAVLETAAPTLEFQPAQAGQEPGR